MSTYNYKLNNNTTTKENCDFIKIPYIEFKKESINNSIINRFEQQVIKYPNNPAIRTIGDTLTYDQLNKYSNRIANSILKKYSKEAVTLLFEHGSNMIMAIVGALKSGNFYIPLDPTYPEKRLEYILADSEAKIIITDTKNIFIAKKIKRNIKRDVEILNLDLIPNNVSDRNINMTIDPQQLAYILYTSGSTGKPKGVVQNHRNVLHFIRNYTNNLHINSNDRITLFSSYCFDAAIMDIFGALLNGALLLPYTIKKNGSMEELQNWMDNEGITIYHSTPTLYRYFMQSLVEDTQFNSVRLVVMGGEAVFKKDVELYKEHFSNDCVFINGLGPTESTVTLQYFINKDTIITGNCIPVGYPVEDTEVYILRKDGTETSINEVGEIIYKSKYLALGYWKQPQKTNEVFSKHPVSGERIYKSGDLGRILPNGSIEFVGRKDFQVKIRGYRIELNEIESTLDSIDGIKKSAVTSFSKNNEVYLAAYYILKEDVSISAEEIKNILLQKLPGYMIPLYIIPLKEFSLTLSGKIDRKSLLNPIVLSCTPSRPYTTENELEKKIKSVWEKVLSYNTIAIEDDFFDIGGHSLLAIKLEVELNRVSIPITYSDIYKYRTIKHMAQFIQNTRNY